MNVGPGLLRRIPERDSRWTGSDMRCRELERVAELEGSDTWQDTKQWLARKTGWRRCDSTGPRKKKGDDCTRTKPSANRTLAFASCAQTTAAGTTRVSQAHPTQNSSSHKLFCCADLDTFYNSQPLCSSTHIITTSSHHSLLLVLDPNTLFPGILAVLFPKYPRVRANCDIISLTPHPTALFVSKILRQFRKAAIERTIACSEVCQKHYYAMSISQSSVLL